MSGPVLVVDDHVLFAQSVTLALESCGAPVRLVEPRSAEAVLAACRTAAPATVLLDLRLGVDVAGAPLDGLDLIADIVATGCRVVVLTGERGDAVWGTAVERGATAVLPKEIDLTVLVDVVTRVVAGADILAPGRRHELLAAAREARVERAARLGVFDRLSPREQHVLRSLAAGNAAAAIAAAAHVSEATVRTQIRAVLSKLGVQSQLQAVAVARRAGWLAPGA